MAPITYTEVADYPSDYKTMRYFKLHDLFTDFESLPEDIKQRNAFKVKFYVLRIEPEKNWREACKMMCPETKKTMSCKELQENSEEMKPIYMLQFICKDSSSQLNKNFYRIMLYSSEENRGEYFFGRDLPACDLYRNEKAYEKLSHHLNALLRFNVQVEAILERVNDYFVIKDTTIK